MTILAAIVGLTASVAVLLTIIVLLLREQTHAAESTLPTEKRK